MLGLIRRYKISKKKALKEGDYNIDSRIYLNLKEALNLNNFTDQNILQT